MRFTSSMLAVAVAAACAAASAQGRDLAHYVNPMTGTGGHGHTFPGPTLPFGMIQPGPDTRLTGWDGSSAYHDSDRVVYGFSHTHLSGTGVSDYGDVLLLPATGAVKWQSGYRFKGEDPLPFDASGYGSHFDKASERAAAGYYGVTLQDYGVKAEVTSTLRTALHRWTFERADQAHVMLDLSHRGELLGSGLTMLDDRTVAGWRRTKAWAVNRPVYFIIRFDHPFKRIGGPSGQEQIKAALAFDLKPGEVLQAKVGISAVDADGAAANLKAEQTGFAFDAVRELARAAWNKQLSKIEVDGGTEKDRRIFYTALYHSFVQPNTFQDRDGRFLGRDGQVHGARDYTRHSVFSLWDTFRAAHPLYTIVERRRSTDFIKTFVAQFKEGGRLPVWELWGNETDCMIAYHVVSVIADAYAKGIRGFDAREALNAMVKSAEVDKFGLGTYRKIGYLQGDQEAESVSKTLEYAYDDWCIAVLATALGEKDIARRFRARAEGWRNLIDAQGHVHPRAQGRWMENYDPAEVSVNFTEANGWQYGFFVPHNIDGLIARVGGEAKFLQLLEDCFNAQQGLSGRHQVDITGLVGQYAHGNEPSHHMAYLYAYAGQPWKTQALVKRLMDEMYDDAPDGLVGNEDCGQMSAWYVMSALGIYSVTPGQPNYTIGTPRFSRTRIHLENGKTFTIRADGSGPYVQDARLNGKPWSNAWLAHQAIMQGGELRFSMGAAPSQWGSSQANRPHSGQAAIEPGVVLAPVAEGPYRFRDQATIHARTLEGADAIHYTTDGSEPGVASPVWSGPLIVTASTDVKLRARRGQDWSPVTDAPAVKLSEQLKLTLRNQPHAQFAAGGAAALVDGVRGGNDFRLGGWLGFYGADLDGVIDLGTERAIKKVSASFLQDQNSWIFMPKGLEVEASVDGSTWFNVGSAQNTVDEHADGSIIKVLAVAGDGRPARYVRVRGVAPVWCPEWHKGQGNRSFIFADELMVE
jgi:predicted alpha-1,2-mannosidase